ncbi:MAG TPA: hypothetical protein VFX20_17200 [Steroidobacteraceae bacterium]|nr:hypothetical protein [Steroidobacteraceae bacterium]
MKQLGIIAFCMVTTLAEAGAAVYPRMAPIRQYEMASRTEEIALARSAGPASISDHARILSLGKHGYETAVAGRNGFVCLVARSWDQGFDNPEFWNPKIRAPECFNAAGARSVLPHYLERTQWVLAGHSVAQMRALTAAARAAGKGMKPRPGSICYMMSKRGYLNDTAAGPWYPHIMTFALGAEPAAWGANSTDSPIAADDTNYKPVTIFMVFVPAWSDGTVKR